MIVIQQEKRHVEVIVLGEFALADFKEFEEAVLYRIKFAGPLNLFVDLRQMLGFTVDVAWEDIRFSRQHVNDFNRIAVLTDSQWLAWSAWLSQLFTRADVRVFDEESAARAWLDEPA